MAMPASTMQETFTAVFKNNRWGNDESVSGAGSALSSSSVKDSVLALDNAIRRFGISSINDVPCGDFYWIPLILGRFRHILYRGFDIVPDLIEWNRERFPSYDFQVADVSVDRLPKADLIFCKDLILHIGHHHIARALRNFKLSGSRFLLISMSNNLANTEELLEEPGAYRHLNLRVEPFNLPEPFISHDYLPMWDLHAIDISFFDALCDRTETRLNTSSANGA